MGDHLALAELAGRYVEPVDKFYRCDNCQVISNKLIETHQGMDTKRHLQCEPLADHCYSV